MQGTNKGGETLNRCITAVAMTFAIATVYTSLVAESQLVRGDVLRQQIQTVLKIYKPDLQITQDAQEPQESLTALLFSSQGKTYGH
ncbi:MAG: hypothetical protein AAF821_13290 [Cyanobacteria bacterium P01_D01_bin.156]